MFFLFRDKVDFVDPNLGKITDAKCGQVRIFSAPYAMCYFEYVL